MRPSQKTARFHTQAEEGCSLENEDRKYDAGDKKQNKTTKKKKTKPEREGVDILLTALFHTGPQASQTSRSISPRPLPGDAVVLLPVGEVLLSNATNQGVIGIAVCQEGTD